MYDENWFICVCVYVCLFIYSFLFFWTYDLASIREIMNIKNRGKKGKRKKMKLAPGRNENKIVLSFV